jgi:hypothetical protein
VSSPGWREPQPRVRRRASALSRKTGLRGESEGRYGSRRDSTCGAPGRSPRRDLFPLIFEFGQLACLARVIGRAGWRVAAESGLVV